MGQSMRFAMPLLLSSVVGCSSVAELDRFSFDRPDAAVADAAVVDASLIDAAVDGGSDIPAVCEGTSTSNRRHFRFALRDMRAHAHHKTFFEIIREMPGNGGRVQAVAVFEGFPDNGDYDLLMKRALSPGDYRVDFYSDVSEDGMYSGIPTPDNAGLDHAWREPGDASGCMTFVHNTDFIDIGVGAASPSGNAFVLNVTNATPFADHPFNMDLLVGGERRTVGQYRIQHMHTGAFEARIPAIVSVSDFYSVEAWVDMNDNGAYDAGSDPSWVVGETQAPNQPEFVLALDLATPQETLPTD